MAEYVFRRVQSDYVWENDPDLQTFKALLMDYQHARDLLDPDNDAQFDYLRQLAERVAKHPYQMRQYPYDPRLDEPIYDAQGRLDVAKAERVFAVPIRARVRELTSGPFYRTIEKKLAIKMAWSRE